MKASPGISLFVMLFTLLVFTDCENPNGPEDDGTTIYSNSFESPADTAGWHVNAMVEFRSDAPPEGGNQSVFVSGGCIYPHFYVDLESATEDRFLKLRCWGKNLSNGGGASLEWFDEESQRYRSIYTGVTDTVWTAYESEDTLFCPAGQPLTLHLAAGGYAPSSILVDLVKVFRVE